MPGIDVSTIEGFDGMTAEEKVDALLKVDVPEKVDLSGYIAKSQFDKVSSELAEAKKTLKGKMTEDEAAKAQADADRLELESKYNELVKKSTIADHTARYMALPGFDEKLARETAEALFDGNMDKVFENQKKAGENYEKTLKANQMRNNPGPDGAGGDDGEGESEAVKFAKKIGKANADANKRSAEILNMYLNGGKK